MTGCKSRLPGMMTESICFSSLQRIHTGINNNTRPAFTDLKKKPQSWSGITRENIAWNRIEQWTDFQSNIWQMHFWVHPFHLKKLTNPRLNYAHVNSSGAGQVSWRHVCGHRWVDRGHRHTYFCSFCLFCKENQQHGTCGFKVLLANSELWCCKFQLSGR